MTRSRKVQTRWYTIGSADYGFLALVYTAVYTRHSAVLVSVCLVLSTFLSVFYTSTMYYVCLVE